MNLDKDIEKKKMQDLKRRFIIFFAVVLITCGVFLRHLVNLQIVSGQENLDKSLKRIVTNGVIYANRGNIYDRNGIPIAGNRMGFCIQYVDTRMSDADKNEMFHRLTRLLDRNGDRYRSTLKNIIDFDTFSLKIKRDGLIDIIGLNDTDKGMLLEASEKDIFIYMRDKTFKIDPSYTDDEAWWIREFRYEIMIYPATIRDPLLIAEDVSIETVTQL